MYMDPIWVLHDFIILRILDYVKEFVKNLDIRLNVCKITIINEGGSMDMRELFVRN